MTTTTSLNVKPKGGAVVLQSAARLHLELHSYDEVMALVDRLIDAADSALGITEFDKLYEKDHDSR